MRLSLFQHYFLGISDFNHHVHGKRKSTSKRKSKFFLLETTRNKKRRKRKTIHIKLFIFWAQFMLFLIFSACVIWFETRREKTTQKSEIFTTWSLKGKRTDKNIFAVMICDIFLSSLVCALRCACVTGSVLIGWKHIAQVVRKMFCALHHVEFYDFRGFVLKPNSCARSTFFLFTKFLERNFPV